MFALDADFEIARETKTYEETGVGRVVCVDEHKFALEDDAGLCTRARRRHCSARGEEWECVLFSRMEASRFLIFQPGPLTRGSGLRISMLCEACTTRFASKAGMPAILLLPPKRWANSITSWSSPRQGYEYMHTCARDGEPNL